MAIFCLPARVNPLARVTLPPCKHALSDVYKTRCIWEVLSCVLTVYGEASMTVSIQMVSRADNVHELLPV